MQPTIKAINDFKNAKLIRTAKSNANKPVSHAM